MVWVRFSLQLPPTNLRSVRSLRLSLRPQLEPRDALRRPVVIMRQRSTRACGHAATRQGNESKKVQAFVRRVKYGGQERSPPPR